MVPLKYLSNFWRTLEMPLITFEIILILTWSAKCVLSSAANQATAYGIADTKRCFSFNFINSRKCKAAAVMEIRIQMHN